MKMYRIADMKELTEEIQQIKETKNNFNTQELEQFKKDIEEQMKSLTPQQRKDMEVLLNEQEKNTQNPGMPNNTTMKSVKNMQQKPVDKYDPPSSNLSKEERAIFSPVEMLFKSKFPQMKNDIRDQKGKVILDDLFKSLTPGNQAELTRHLNDMKPILRKFKQKEDAVKNKNQIDKNNMTGIGML